MKWLRKKGISYDDIEFILSKHGKELFYDTIFNLEDFNELVLSKLGISMSNVVRKDSKYIIKVDLPDKIPFDINKLYEILVSETKLSIEDIKRMLTEDDIAEIFEDVIKSYVTELDEKYIFDIRRFDNSVGFYLDDVTVDVDENKITQILNEFYEKHSDDLFDILYAYDVTSPTVKRVICEELEKFIKENYNIEDIIEVDSESVKQFIADANNIAAKLTDRQFWIDKFVNKLKSQ